MVDNIFIDYVNQSLSDDPANLLKIYKVISNYVSIPNDIKSISNISIQLLIKFSEFKNFPKANSYRKQLINKQTKFSSLPIRTMGHTTVGKFKGVIIESTFSYVFGYKEGYCRNLCPLFGGVQKIHALGVKQIEGPPHLKCFECDQQYVRYILNEIVRGKEFSKIIGFPQFLANGRQLFKTGLLISKAGSHGPYKEVIKEETIYDPIGQILSLGIFIGCAVSYSLGNFLVKKDSKKRNPLFLRLKKCVHCGKFKIGDRMTKKGNNTFCSIECNDLFHREKRKKTKYHKNYMKEYRKL